MVTCYKCHWEHFATQIWSSLWYFIIWLRLSWKSINQCQKLSTLITSNIDNELVIKCHKISPKIFTLYLYVSVLKELHYFHHVKAVAPNLFVTMDWSMVDNFTTTLEWLHSIFNTLTLCSNAQVLANLSNPSTERDRLRLSTPLRNCVDHLAAPSHTYAPSWVETGQ